MSVANAAGNVPPLTQAKNRPLALAVKPGSAAAAIARTTSLADIPFSGKCGGNGNRISSGEPRDATGRVSSEAKYRRTSAKAISSESMKNR